jgi:hypothetical protein
MIGNFSDQFSQRFNWLVSQYQQFVVFRCRSHNTKNRPIIYCGNLFNVAHGPVLCPGRNPAKGLQTCVKQAVARCRRRDDSYSRFCTQ